MLARLGHVIYWASTGISLLLLAGAIADWHSRSSEYATTYAALGILVFLFGRAVLYVLAGR